MALEERNRCLQRFPCFRTVFHHGLLSLAFDGEVLVHLHVRRSPEHQTHDETDAHLSHNLVLTLQAFLVALENLDEVVHAAQETQPYGGDDHQDEIDVAQTSQQNHRNEDSKDDDDTTHRRHANLLHSKRVDAGIALGLSDLLVFEILDEFLAKPC